MKKGYVFKGKISQLGQYLESLSMVEEGEGTTEGAGSPYIERNEKILECPQVRVEDGLIGQNTGSKDRISRDEMFREMVMTISKRSTCQRGKVGALIVKDGRPISIGYNGPPKGVPECGSCAGANCQISIHAEMNAIAFAAKNGVSIEGTVLYCSMSPCINCAKIILNSGIREVVFLEDYRLTDGIDLLKQFIEVRKI